MVKTAKQVTQVGQCNDHGASFLPSDAMDKMHEAFLAVNKTIREREGSTTGPARVYIIVEQDFLE